MGPAEKHVNTGEERGGLCKIEGKLSKCRGTSTVLKGHRQAKEKTSNNDTVRGGGKKTSGKRVGQKMNGGMRYGDS